MQQPDTRPAQEPACGNCVHRDGAGRILVVDDSKPFRQSLVRFLEMEGFEVLEAENGKRAVQECHRALPDLIVMDVNMPEMDGFEALRCLREFSVVPVLMLSCRGAEMDRVVGLTSGADHYMTKPFSASELLVRVQALLRRYRRWQPTA